MFQHILFPTDTSDRSNEGFSYAVDLMKKYGGKITILNIHEEFLNHDERQYLRISPARYQELVTEKAVKSREIVENLVNSAGVCDECEVLIREGHPRQMIIKIAEELKVDLIVMSSNGRSNLKEQIIGSVAEYVVSHSHKPVLVIK